MAAPGLITAPVRRPLLLRLRRASMAVVAVLAALEIVLRLFGYASFVDFRPDERLLWVPIPGRNRLTVVNRQPIMISEDGFRYPARLGPAATGEKRVFVFGDSVTMGWGVDDRSHYSAALETLLAARRCGGPVRVVSAGVNAYPNALVLERMKKVFEDGHRPDAVILAYSFNVAFENMAKLQDQARVKFLRRIYLKHALRQIALYNFFIEDILRNAVYYRIRSMLVQGSWETATGMDTAGGTREFRAGLEEAVRICRSHRARLILLLLPSMGQKSELHPFQAEMRNFARNGSAAFADMITAFSPEDHERLFMDHVHPNVAGHRLIAEQLVPVTTAALGCSQ